MATYSTTAAPSNGTDAEFRAWALVFDTLFTQTGGWIRTSDTGQIDLATAARPGAANTKVGYAVYRMDDALSSVILKLAFGSGTAQNTPGVWFSIGTKTDGAGNFVDANDGDRAGLLFDQYSQSAPAMQPAGSQSTLRQCFGSVSTDRMVLMMFEAQPTVIDNSNPKTCTSIAVLAADGPTGEGNYPLVFSVERARDWSGVTIGTEVIITWAAVNARLGKQIYLSLDHSLPPLLHISGMVYASEYKATATNIHLEYHDSLLIANAPATPLIPFKRNTYPAPPGINIATSRFPRFEFVMGIAGSCTGAETGAYLTGRTIGLSPFGTARTYRTCAGMRTANFTDSGQDSSGFVYILYE